MGSSSSQPSLIRAIGPLTATAIVVGTVIGSGIFKKPQVIALDIPYFGVTALAWLMGGLLALMGALALAEVAVLYPKVGGNYVFLREGYGRLAGFLWGWVEFWIIRPACVAALATVFTESLHDILRNPAWETGMGWSPAQALPSFLMQKEVMTVAVILSLAIVNVRGVRWGGLLQLFITLIKVGSLLGIIALPFLAAYGIFASAAVPKQANLMPVWPNSWGEVSIGRIGAGLLGVLWSYHGWMNVAPVAGEVRRPQRDLPLALLGGTAIVAILYLGCNFAYSLIIPRDEMVGLTNTTVATVFSERLLGTIGGVLAPAAVLFSVFGALNGNLLVGPRVLYAMGEDGLAPRALRAVHPRYHTPAVAILVIAGWASLLVIVAGALTRGVLPEFTVGQWTINLNVPKGKDIFNILTDFAMFGAITFETMAVTTIFVFRRRFPTAERPYRCWGYPVVPLLYLILPIFIATNMFLYQRTEAVAGISFIAMGAVAYFLWTRTYGRTA